MIKKSPYDILGLKGEFEFKEIKKAYRKAIIENPPEKNPKAFAEISDAYDILTNSDYLFRGLADHLFLLEIDIKLDNIQESDNSKYLKTIFEIPFS